MTIIRCIKVGQSEKADSIARSHKIYQVPCAQCGVLVWLSHSTKALGFEARCEGCCGAQVTVTVSRPEIQRELDNMIAGYNARN